MGIWHSSDQIQLNEDSEPEDPDYRPYRKGSMDFTTDAVNTCSLAVESHGFPQLQHQMTEAKIAVVEEELDLYEKVSLVFLLYDDSEIALQYSIQLLEGAQKSVLVEWAQFAMKTDKWQDKLLEAFCIIQNYKVLRQLGCNKTEASVRFLPLVENTSLFIDLTKKKLYRLCENLTTEETTKLLKLVRRDFENMKLLYKHFEESCLEMYLLYWITIKYITLSDLTNLCKVLKVLDKYESADSLKSVTRSATAAASELDENGLGIDENGMKTIAERSHNNKDLDVVLPIERSLSIVSSGAGSSFQQDRIRRNSDEDRYPINSEAPGLCLIINQEHFYTEPDQSLKHLLPPTEYQLEERKGTNVDRDKLEDTFKKFGFEVVVVNDRTHVEIKETIEKNINKIAGHSSLIICVLSHGTTGMVYGVNSIPLEVREIQNLMTQCNHKNLRGKPKVLILQSCQGSECQEVSDDENDDELEADEDDLETDGPRSRDVVPRTADMLVFWATVPGFGAVRDKKKGAWFIQSLCDAILLRGSDTHFEDICTYVKKEVIQQRWKTKTTTRVMVPVKESTLSRFFYLPQVKL